MRYVEKPMMFLPHSFGAAFVARRMMPAIVCASTRISSSLIASRKSSTDASLTVVLAMGVFPSARDEVRTEHQQADDGRSRCRQQHGGRGEILGIRREGMDVRHRQVCQ